MAKAVSREGSWKAVRSDRKDWAKSAANQERQALRTIPTAPVLYIEDTEFHPLLSMAKSCARAQPKLLYRTTNVFV
jgi:hypothetical protein